MNGPVAQESAVIQALMVRAKDGQVALSARALSDITGLSRTSVQRTLDRLQSTGQVESVRSKSGPNSTVWVLPQLLAQKAAQPVSNTVRNAVPTMSYQLPPSGVVVGWFERTFRDITRANLAVYQGLLQPACRKCNDTGYYVEPTSEEYSRDWLHTCECEAGRWKVIPDLGEYVPDREDGLCLMCQNTGWVYVGNLVRGGVTYEQVQRCYSCRKTWS